mgnify:FL=1
MLAIERLFRRFGYSFGFAWLFVALFEFKQMYFGIPVVGYILGAVLFICSWQVEKEVRRHILFEENSDDLVEKMLWKISGRKKYRKYIIWQGLFTFGAALTLIAALIDLNIVLPFYVRVCMVLGVVLLFAITRFFDPKTRPEYYEE